MDIIQAWQQKPDYKIGVAIFKELIGDSQSIIFFNQAFNPGKDTIHFKMLVSKLSAFRAKCVRNGKKLPKVNIDIPRPRPASKSRPKRTQKPQKPAKAERVETTPTGAITRDKETTNRLMAFDWDKFTKREKEYFFNNKKIFEEKKRIFNAARDNRAIIGAKHAKMKASESTEEREVLANEIVDLQKQDAQYWEEMDKFEKPLELKDLSGAELVKMRSNLRSNITKTRKKMEDKDNKKFPVWSEKLADYQYQLQQVEKLIEE